MVEKQVAGTVQLPITEFGKTDLVLTAKWDSADVVSFFFDAFCI